MSGAEQPKKAFVTGATGGIGTALCERLSELGWNVVALVRLESDSTYISTLKGLELATADLVSETALVAAMKGCDVIFHLAAKVHAGPNEPEDSFRRTNVEGTRAVVNAAITSQVRSFVFFSSVAVYPDSDSMLDENSAVGPSTPYGSTKLAAEAIVLEQQSRMHVTILRLPVVYGPRDRGNIGRLIDAVARKRFVIPGTGLNIKTMVAVDNVIDAAILCAGDPRAAGKVYVVADDDAPTLRETVAAIARSLGVSVPRRVPLGVMSILGRAADGARWLIDLPLSSDQIQKLASNTRYSAARIRNELGFTPKVSLDEGMKKAVAGFAKRP